MRPVLLTAALAAVAFLLGRASSDRTPPGPKPRDESTWTTATCAPRMMSVGALPTIVERPTHEQRVIGHPHVRGSV